MAKKQTRRCPVCGRFYYRTPAAVERRQNPTCGRECARKMSSRVPRVRERQQVLLVERRGGKLERHVLAPAWAQEMADRRGRIREHRLVVAMAAGRLLSSTESVHHLTGDPLDNRPEALELWPTHADHRLAEEGKFRPGVANRWSPRGAVPRA